MCIWGCRGILRRARGRCRQVKGALRLRMWNAAAVKKPAGAGCEQAAPVVLGG